MRASTICDTCGGTLVGLHICTSTSLTRYGSPARAALRHALETVYAGDQSVETDAVLDQLDTLGYRVTLR